ncbi:MAG: DUF1501 domain-containing protein [Planctomycetes bacterium]|nr:DUF1501 domain-containing protein [Planctomycetota bacterium]
MHTRLGVPQRRDFLRAGLLGLAGLGLSDLLRLRAGAVAQGRPVQDTACILVWLGGGPSHLETYDMKPEAPAEYRGAFRPIRTCVPGLDVCELLPRHARIADRLTLIRSLTHEFTGHQDGAQHVLTGWPAVLTGGGTTTSVHPEVGSVIKRMRPSSLEGQLSYVAISHPIGFVGPAYLGRGYEPFVAAGDPSSPTFRVPNIAVAADVVARLDDRRALLHGFDGMRRDLDARGTMAAMDRYEREAVALLTGEAARRAFDLSAVDTRLRDRYGRSNAGQKLLLARQLVEAGVSFVTAEIASYEGVDGGWDDHSTARDIFDAMRRRLPVYDQALTALVEDIYDRGLGERVLVIVMGEFGRTPRLDTRDGRPGRDHWPYAMSVLVFGGGMRVGQVIGATDSRAERPRERQLHPTDLLATLYHFLGIDRRHEFRNHAGRPLPILPGGNPISELLG